MELNDLKVEYNEALERMNALGAELDASDTDTFDEVNTRFIAEEASVRTLGARIEDLEKVTTARAAHKPAALAATPAIRVGAEAATYDGQNGNDFVADILRRQAGDSEAGERLARHTQEMRSSSQTSSGSGTGADLVVPLYLSTAFVKNTAGRPFADVFTKRGAPQTTSFNIPRIGGTAAAVHTENAALQETDATTDTVNVAATAIGAGQTLSIEMIELGIPSVTDAYFQAMEKQYDKTLDGLLFTSSTSGRLGVLNLSTAGNSVAYTDASPTGAEFLTAVNKAVSKVQSVGFADPDVVVMHPRRLAWLMSEVDGNGRPLVVDQGFGPMNAMGENQSLRHQGFRGYLVGSGLRIIVDANVPATQGASTNEDIVVVADSSYLWLWESQLRIKTADQTKADTLSSFLYVYALVAWTMVVQPGAVSWVSGTGLVAPSGF